MPRQRPVGRERLRTSAPGERLPGAVMLRPGWMERYVRANERDRIRPMLTAFGFIWAGLMFLTAAANTALVVFADPVIWAKFNLLFPSISMVGLFLLQNVYIRARAAKARYRVPAVSSRSARLRATPPSHNGLPRSHKCETTCRIGQVPNRCPGLVLA